MNFSHPAGVNCTKVGFRCCLGPRHKPLPSRTAYTSLLEKCLYSTTNLNSHWIINLGIVWNDEQTVTCKAHIVEISHKDTGARINHVSWDNGWPFLIRNEASKAAIKFRSSPIYCTSVTFIITWCKCPQSADICQSSFTEKKIGLKLLEHHSPNSGNAKAITAPFQP